MSREIKCRGIATCDVFETTIKKGDMIFGQIVYENGRSLIVGPVAETDSEYISLESWCPVEPWTVGQFTGLKDKNGKEIYEGDILQHPLVDKFYPGKVEWDVTKARIVVWFEWKGNKGQRILCEADYFDKTTIIGNVHENPELLEQGK